MDILFPLCQQGHSRRARGRGFGMVHSRRIGSIGFPDRRSNYPCPGINPESYPITVPSAFLAQYSADAVPLSCGSR